MSATVHHRRAINGGPSSGTVRTAAGASGHINATATQRFATRAPTAILLCIIVLGLVAAAIALLDIGGGRSSRRTYLATGDSDMSTLKPVFLTKVTGHIANGSVKRFPNPRSNKRESFFLSTSEVSKNNSSARDDGVRKQQQQQQDHPRSQRERRSSSSTVASMSLRCSAVNPYGNQGGLYDYQFYHRFDGRPPHTNFAVLTRAARFVPELSSSPLIQSYFNHGDQKVAEAAAFIQQHLDGGYCSSGSDDDHGGAAAAATDTPSSVSSASKRLFVVVTCRDQPKRAWEFVAYHLLLGATNIIMLDVSSGARPGGLPPLRTYLAPWITLGVLEIVEPDAVMAATAGGADEEGSGKRRDAHLGDMRYGLDADDAFVLQRYFLREITSKIAAKNPTATVLVTDDVNDFFIISASVVGGTTTAAASSSPQEDDQRHGCLWDVYRSARHSREAASSILPSTAPETASFILTIPKARVGPEALFDNSRSALEYIGFATGSTKQLLHDAKMFVANHGHHELLNQPKDLGQLLDQVWHHFAVMGSAVELARLMHPNNEAKHDEHVMVVANDAVANQSAAVIEAIISTAAHHSKAAAGGDSGGVYDTLVFADGSSWTQLRKHKQNNFQHENAVALTARVVRVSFSNQETLERAVDRCYLSSYKPQVSSRAIHEFDVARVRPAIGNNVDDLADGPNSLKKNGFVALHRRLLAMMQFAVHGRRERTYPQRGVQVNSHVQRILQPVAVYGPNAGADKYAHPNEVDASEITNENLVSGVVQLMPEAPLAPLNQSRLHRTLVHYGQAKPSSSASINVTFCAVVRNRAKITLEWIVYHTLHGVQKFIVVDDNSTDGLADVLAPLVQENIVSIVPADDGSNFYRFKQRVVKGPLLAAYGKCVALETERSRREHHAESPWIGFIDSDEFLVIPSGELIPDVVHRVHSTNANGIGAVAFSWRNVAPANNDMFDRSPTQFHRTAFSIGESDRIQRVKVIARSDAALAMDTAHKVDLDGGLLTVFPNGQVIQSPGWFTGANAATERGGILLHYHARSFSSWLQRWLDGFADNNNQLWPFDINTYYGRWFADTAKGFMEKDKQWLEAIPQWKERLEVVEALLTDCRSNTSRVVCVA